jgi:hypothetical protein
LGGWPQRHRLVGLRSSLHRETTARDRKEPRWRSATRSGIRFESSRTERPTASDERTGAYFELDAGPDEALDVFYHPYAHAAFRGVPYDEALLASWAEAAASPTR